MTDTNQSDIQEDVLTMVGGHFSPKALGPDAYDEMLQRARSRANEYFDVFDSLFLGPKFDPISQSNLLLPLFLELMVVVAPERAKSSAQQLVKQYNAILTFHDSAKDQGAFRELLPEDSQRMLHRFASRRNELQELLKN
jgi:hypothetical protein